MLSNCLLNCFTRRAYSVVEESKDVQEDPKVIITLFSNTMTYLPPHKLGMLYRSVDKQYWMFIGVKSFDEYKRLSNLIKQRGESSYCFQLFKKFYAGEDLSKISTIINQQGFSEERRIAPLKFIQDIYKLEIAKDSLTKIEIEKIIGSYINTLNLNQQQHYRLDKLMNTKFGPILLIEELITLEDNIEAFGTEISNLLSSKDIFIALTKKIISINWLIETDVNKIKAVFSHQKSLNIISANPDLIEEIKEDSADQIRKKMVFNANLHLNGL